MADFGTLGYATIDPGGINMELISFTGISSSSLTGVTRGLGFEADYTSVTALKLPHSAGTVVVFSNSPQFYDSFVNKNDDETIAGKHTFTTVPASTAAPVAGDDLVNLTKLNATALGTTNIDQTVVAGNAGETVAAGQLVYQDATDNEWKLCDANTATTVEQVMLGIAQGAGTDGAAITGGVLLPGGIDKNQTGMTQGDPMFASDTPGAIASSAGTTERTIGIAKSATELYFDPYYAHTIKEVDKDKLEAVTSSASELNQLDGATISATQLTEAGTFFGATDISGAEAETLTDGSNADALHVHSGAIGLDSANIFSYNHDMKETSTLVSGAVNTSFAGALTFFESSSTGWSILGALPNVIGQGVATNGLRWDDSLDITVEFMAGAFNGVTGDRTWGMMTSAVSTYNDTSIARVCFGIDGTTIYAVTCTGAAATTTDVTGAYTVANLNHYKIVFNPGTDAKFYINGTLVHTETLTLPTSTSNVYIGASGSASGEDVAFSKWVIKQQLQ